MSQNLTPTIDPNVVNGTQLATDWGQTLAALLSSHSGTARPAYAVAGTFWLNSSTNTLNYYDGTSDIPVFTFDTTNHLLNPPIGGGINTLASAATVDLGSVPQAYVSISGTTAITSFGSSAKAGQAKLVNFAGTLTLTYNATSMILPGAANIATAAGDAAIMLYLGSGNWRCICYTLANPGNVNAISINGGQLAGLRNRTINGDFRIDQLNQGASQTITAAASAAYTVDGFYATCTGANVTGKQVSGSAPDQYLYQFTGAASTTAIAFGQRYEATIVYDLTSTTATFSVKLANSLLTTVTWTAYYPTATDNWTSRTPIATGTFTVNSTLTKYTANIALGANISAGLEIELSVGAQTSGTWQIGEWQLENGSVATPFERRPIGMELALCQRYFENIPPTSVQFPWASATQVVATSVAFHVTKRAVPTITLTGAGGSTGTATFTSASAYVDGALLFFSGNSGNYLTYSGGTAAARL